MSENQELPQRRRGGRRSGRGRRGAPRPPPAYSTTNVVVLGVPTDDQLDNIRNQAAAFGTVTNAECRTTRNDRFLYEVEFADEAAAAAAVEGLQLGEDVSVAFKRLPRPRVERPRGEGDPLLVYVNNIASLPGWYLLQWRMRMFVRLCV